MDGQATADQRHRTCGLLWRRHILTSIVQTTFFAATEGQLLVITTPADDNTPETRIRAAANGILAGALVIHLCAGKSVRSVVP